MAGFKVISATMFLAAATALPATVALATSPECAGLQRQVDAGVTLTGDALLNYDECFPIQTDPASQGVTNFAPGLLPLVAGVGGAAALAVGLGGADSTGSTSGVGQ